MGLYLLRNNESRKDNRYFHIGRHRMDNQEQW